MNTQRLKKFMVHLWAFRIILLRRHKKFRCVIIFLSGKQLKIPAGMWQILHGMEMIHRTIGWRRDEQGTHEHAHGSWILWSVSRVRLETMHSLSYITSWLPYITLCYLDSRFLDVSEKFYHSLVFQTTFIHSTNG